MIKEEDIEENNLIQYLNEVINKINDEKIVFKVYRENPNNKREYQFIMGPKEICGSVLGLYDEEYGWPFSISLNQVKSVSDIKPSYRKHPFISGKNKNLAVSIQLSEYDVIKNRIAQKID